MDTGASVSYVSSTIVERVKLPFHKEEVFLKAVNGQKLTTMGYLNGEVMVGSTSFPIKFVVVSDLACKIILGQDFLWSHGGVMDFRLGKLILGNEVVDFIPDDSTSFVFRTDDSKRDDVCTSYFEFENCLERNSILLRGDSHSADLSVADYAYFLTLDEDCSFAVESKDDFILGADLDTSHRSSLEKLLQRNRDRFAFDSSQLGRCDIVDVDIETINDQPIVSRPYRVSPAQREVIDKQVEEMLRLGVIEESNSSYASPVVLVKKPDGSWRFCIDYRRLNKLIISDSYPIPAIDDLIAYLANAKFFAELDLNSGYWQTAIRDGKHKTAFITPSGLYQFNVVPFGLKTSQAVFQRMMDRALGDLRYRNAVVYVDNIIVYADSFERFEEVLEELFVRFRRANLTFKPSKCKFGLSELNVLGYHISGNGISPDSSKIEAIRDVLSPTSTKEVKRVLGLFSYYRKFVGGFAKITLPLVKLLNKGVKFVWSDECQLAFDRIKDLLCNPPVLRYFQSDKEVVTRLMIDAFDEALGAALMQEYEGRMHPVAFASRKLSAAEKRYSVTERECLSLVWALRYFRTYLWGSSFQVVTDHKALCWLQSKKDMSGRLARWALAIQEWDFQIVYCSGRDNVVADYLSRNPLLVNEAVSQGMEFNEDGLELFHIEVSSIRQAQLDDSFCVRVMELLRSEGSHRSFFIRDELLYKRVMRRNVLVDVLVLPKQLFGVIMKELHDDAWSGGHLGFAKTLGRFRSRFFMPLADKEIMLYIRSCVPCQERKGGVCVAPLMPVVVSGMMERVGVDVVGPFRTSSRGNKFVIVALEYVSRYAVCRAVPRVTSEVIVDFLVEEIFCRFGGVREILTNRGTVFTAHVASGS